MEAMLRSITPSALSSKRSDSSEASGAKGKESSSSSSKTSGVWRAVLRVPEEGEVRLEWKSSDMAAAREALAQRVSGIYGEHRGASSPAASGASAVASFIQRVTWLELCRLQSSERLELSSLPFPDSGLVSLKVLRLSGEDMLLSQETLEALLKQKSEPAMLEIDLQGQKAIHVPQIEHLLTAGVMLPGELRVLRLRKNGIKALPAAFIQQLTGLVELDVRENKLAEVPAGLLQTCSLLEVLNLESNGITVPALDFRDCRLSSLRIGLNALEYLPTLAPLTCLEELSVYGIHVVQRTGQGRSDPLTVFQGMPVTGSVLRASGTPLKMLPYTKECRAEARPSLALLFRSSASFHPLLASLLAALSTDGYFQTHILKDYPNAAGLQHILTMSQAPEPASLDACVALAGVMRHEDNARALFEREVTERLIGLLCPPTGAAQTPQMQLYVLHTLRGIASASKAMCEMLLQKGTGRYEGLSHALLQLIKDPNTHGAVLCSLMVLIGALAFSDANRALLLSDVRVLTAIRAVAERLAGAAGDKASLLPSSQWRPQPAPDAKPTRHPNGEASPVVMVAEESAAAGGGGGDKDKGQKDQGKEARRRAEAGCIDAGTQANVLCAARRALAILGDNDFLHTSLGVGREGPGTRSRGVRILCIDGGGVKGVASIRMIAELEKRCSQPLHKLFDLVIGTSAGAIIASGLGNKMNMAECEKAYKVLTRNAFSLPKEREAEEDLGGAPASVTSTTWWQKLKQSGSSMRRVLMTGAKYDAGPLMVGLREAFDKFDVETSMIDSALENETCRTAMVATVCSLRPLKPFVFRNYQLPPGVGSLFPGGAYFQWLEGMRASSAAPYFFEEFGCGGERFQDGAIVANNPTVIGLHEAQRLFPGRPIDLVLSVGTGKAPTERREQPKRTGGWSLIDSFGENMIESATSSERIAEAVEILSPMVPHSSFFRLQIEDERCNVELDDTSPEAQAGLCSAVEEYIQANSRTYSAVARMLSDRRDSTSAGGGGRRKKGIGSGLDVLVIESCYARERADSLAIGTVLKEHGVPCEAHCFNNSACSSRRLDPHYFAALLRASPCRVVHVACEGLRSGGDVVLEWETKAMQLDAGSVRDMLLTSASHAQLLQAAESAEAEGGAEEGGGEGGEEEGAGVLVDHAQAFAGCSKRLARKMRRESSYDMATAEVGDGPGDDGEEAAWHQSEIDKEMQLLAAHAASDAPEEAADAPAEEEASERPDAEGTEETDPPQEAQGEPTPPPAPEPAPEGQELRRDDSGKSVGSSASKGEKSAGEEIVADVEAVAKRTKRMVEMLSKHRVVEVSQLERWMFLGCRDSVDSDGTQAILTFEKAKATCIVDWMDILSPNEGDEGSPSTLGEGSGIEGKVLILQSPLPQQVAENIIAAGAEAVVMPLRSSGPPISEEVWTEASGEGSKPYTQ